MGRTLDRFTTDPGMWPRCTECGGGGMCLYHEGGYETCGTCGGLGVEQPRDKRGRFVSVADSMEDNDGE